MMDYSAIFNKSLQEKQFQDLLADNQFFMQHGKDVFNSFLEYEIEPDILMGDLERYRNSKLGYDDFVTKELTGESQEVFILLGKVVAHADLHAANKREWNEYDDLRVLAKAQVRQHNWVNHLISYKVNRQLQELTPSVKFAVQYFTDPARHLTVLSEKHRVKISKALLGRPYDEESFMVEILDFFESAVNLNPENHLNKTRIISELLYAHRPLWLEEKDNHEATEDPRSFEPDRFEIRLLYVLRKLEDRKAVEEYFDVLGDVFRSFDLQPDDPRVVTRVRIQTKPLSLILILNFRWTWALFEKQGELGYGFMVAGDDIGRHSLPDAPYPTDTFQAAENRERALVYKWKSQYQREDLRAMHEAIPLELRQARRSNRRSDHNPALFRAAIDEQYRDLLFDIAFSDTPIPTLGASGPDHIDVSMMAQPKLNMPLNQILYGPPGTGKTYRTMAQSIQIIDRKVPEGRGNLKRRYRELVSEGRIAFTTFHQSFSYEDFVEGIRADTKDGVISYKVKPGVFLQTSRAAQLSLAEVVASQQNTTPTESRSDYDQVFEEYREQVEQKLEAGPFVLETSTGKEMEAVEITTQGNLNLRHSGYSKKYTVSKARLKKLWQRFDQIEDIQNVHRDIRDTIGGANTTAYWVVFNDFKRFEADFEMVPADEGETAVSEADLDKIDFGKLDSDQLATADRYVLIIDEINRGNIARILGELITLLEPSKRLGADDEQRVILPYSKGLFGVPPNLYLIGTMNTADRSIARLDTALRRRFHFKEVLPDPQILGEVHVSGVDLVQLLTTLNQRIEYLFDRDHTLGHAYFMGLRSAADLNVTFRDKVIPLLQEYFYGDWEKICLVLGDHPDWGKQREYYLLQAEDLNGDKLFGQEPDQYKGPQHYHLNPALLNESLPEEAFQQIYQQAPTFQEPDS